MKTFNTSNRNAEAAFTLVEILIAVVIISVLLSIGIPIMTSHLEKSRESADISNMDAAKDAASIVLVKKDTSFYYDAENGVLVKATAENLSGIRPYGKGTDRDAGCEDYKLSTDNDNDTFYTGESDVSGKIIKVTITTTVYTADLITLEWVSK